MAGEGNHAVEKRHDLPEDEVVKRIGINPHIASVIIVRQ